MEISPAINTAIIRMMDVGCIDVDVIPDRN